MELVGGTLFIGTAIIAVTELFKHVRDKDYTAAVVILVAAVLGLIVALVDTKIGVEDLTVAQGVMAGLAASGVAALAKKV